MVMYKFKGISIIYLTKIPGGIQSLQGRGVCKIRVRLGGTIFTSTQWIDIQCNQFELLNHIWLYISSLFVHLGRNTRMNKVDVWIYSFHLESISPRWNMSLYTSESFYPGEQRRHFYSYLYEFKKKVNITGICLLLHGTLLKLLN